VRAIENFVVEELSNWYVRNNRRRFWAKGDDPSKMRAYLTLHRVLIGLCRLTAPVTPFTSELLFKELMGQSPDTPLSVHMTSFPQSDESLIDANLEETMGLVEKIVSLGRAARSRKNLKVRQPLSELLVSLPARMSFDKLDGFVDIISGELNIKTLSPSSDLGQYVSLSAKLNFKTAGPRLGSDVKRAAEIVAELDSEAVKDFSKSRQLEVAFDDRKVVLSDQEVEVVRLEKEGFAVESDGALSVALMTDLSEELIQEGFARELVNKIQNMRKSSGLQVTDRIRVTLDSSERVKEAAQRHDEFIRSETLAEVLEFAGIDPTDAREWNINGEKTSISVVKV
jgi:isoleucyl-tRNA synthetase